MEPLKYDICIYKKQKHFARAQETYVLENVRRHENIWMFSHFQLGK